MKLDKFGKTALVLAGGGITGAVYEIGALRAIDDLLIDRSVNDLDVYVGTSAGALVSSLLVNGVFLSMLTFAFGRPPLVMFSLLILSGLVAQISSDISRLVMYRRGF